MTLLILSIHIIACVLLILIVLLQTGKGTDMGATFGSASGQVLFGSGGGATALGKITTVVAIIFMLTSLTMAYTSGHRSSKTIMNEKTSAVETTVNTGANTANTANDISNTSNTSSSEEAKKTLKDTAIDNKNIPVEQKKAQ